MISLDPPRGLAADPEQSPWQAAGLSQFGLARFLKTARAAGSLRGEVEVLLTGNRELRRLNRAFRGKNKATDVLSFPAPTELADVYAGDLAISLEIAAKQAEEHGHTLRDEVRVLLLHGLLHLHGLDHEVDDGVMAVREAELRRRLRLPNGLIARTETSARLGVAPLRKTARELARARRWRGARTLHQVVS